MEHKERSLNLWLMLLIIFALLLAGCSTKKGEVKGVFVNSEGELLSEEINVILEPLATFDDGNVGWSFEYQLSDEYAQRLQELVTNDGTFLFEDVVPGPYWVEANLKGSPIQISPAFEVAEGGVVDFGEIVVK